MRSLKLIAGSVLLILLALGMVLTISSNVMSSDLRAAAQQVGDEDVVVPEDSVVVLDEWPWVDSDGGGKGKSSEDTEPPSATQIKSYPDSDKGIITMSDITAVLNLIYLPTLR